MTLAQVNEAWRVAMRLRAKCAEARCHEAFDRVPTETGWRLTHGAERFESDADAPDNQRRALAWVESLHA